MKEAQGRTSYKNKGAIVDWRFVHTDSLSDMMEMGFAMADGYYSIGYDKDGKPIEARRLKAEGDEITLFLDHNTEGIEKLWNKQIKPKHS